jgi:shikimate kinase
LEGPIALVGYMGSGKGTVGRTLARSLGWGFVDLDHEISRSARRTIPEIFEHFGEERFRDMEHQALVGVLEGLPGHGVACAGPAVRSSSAATSGGCPTTNGWRTSRSRSAGDRRGRSRRR